MIKTMKEQHQELKCPNYHYKSYQIEIEEADFHRNPTSIVYPGKL